MPAAVFRGTGATRRVDGMTGMPGRIPMVIRNIPDAIAAVPYLLGFHPSDSLIVIAFAGPHGTCAIRVDLAPAETAEAAERLGAMLASNRFRKAILIGYGPEPAVLKAALVVGEQLLARGIALIDAARVQDGRWWSLTRADAEDGHPYDSSATAVAAQATYSGHVALADRNEMARTVAPLTGPPRVAMNKATQQAKNRLEIWRRRLSPTQLRRRMAKEGLTLLDRVYQPATAPKTTSNEACPAPDASPGPNTPDSHPSPETWPGGRLRPNDNEVAWLGILLTSLRVRDEAWIRIDHDDPAEDIAFWRDFVRRVDPQYADAPACLLAYAAYIAGNGGLANMALERASPTYSMGALIKEIIDAGIPPSEVRIRMTAEELANVYADRDEDEEEDPNEEIPPLAC
jgi:hypothetical protein